MELIPIEHSISEAVETALALAELYQAAGLEAKAESIRADAILEICEDNNIAVLKGTHNEISGYFDTNWGLQDLAYYKGDVPAELLNRMVGIKDKSRLRIGTPQKHMPDPILFYKLPHFDSNYIQLARWK